MTGISTQLISTITGTSVTQFSVRRRHKVHLDLGFVGMANVCEPGSHIPAVELEFPAVELEKRRSVQDHVVVVCLNCITFCYIVLHEDVATCCRIRQRCLQDLKTPPPQEFSFPRDTLAAVIKHESIVALIKPVLRVYTTQTCTT